ncbi:MAG TPA: DUF4476 domain-containing protein [Myxococcaceae bacterium]
MKQILRAALVASLFASSAVLAQEVEMNMNVQVDEDGMPNANIQMMGVGADGEAQGVKMKVRAGGANANMNVKVKGNVQTTETYSESYTETSTTSSTSSPPPQRHVRPSPPPPSEPMYRDCGTGRDPGCTMTRNGQYAMDADIWNGFYQALKSQNSELTREEMAEKMLKKNYLTAQQFGLVLDLFKSELTRMDVAKVAAPRVVNPQHAMGFSSKWNSSISAGEYSELISEQQP